jgi:hypothetical protein
MPAASSRLSRKCSNEGEGNLSSPSSACASGSKKKKVDSPAAMKKKAVITTAAAAPAPVVTPAPVPAPVVASAPVLTPVVEPAEKKKAVTPTTAAAPAPVVPPVVESPSKRSKGSGIVAVGSRAPVVSVAPSVETAPQKQAHVVIWRIVQRKSQRMQVMKTIPKTTLMNLMILRNVRMRMMRILAQMSSWKRLKRPRMKVLIMR